MDNYFAGQALAEEERRRGTWRFQWRLATLAIIVLLIAAVAWAASPLFVGLLSAALCGAVVGEAYFVAEERWVLAAAAYEFLSRQISPMPTLAQARRAGTTRAAIGWILFAMVIFGLVFPTILFALAFHSFVYSWPLAAVLATLCWLLGVFHRHAHWTLWIGFAAVVVWSLGIKFGGDHDPAFYINHPMSMDPQTRVMLGFVSLLTALISIVPIFLKSPRAQAIGWVVLILSCVAQWNFFDWSNSAPGGILAVVPAPALLPIIIGTAFYYVRLRNRAK